MSKETHVDPAELRAAAHAADAIADDMEGPATKAVKEAGAAGSSLNGWTFGSALAEVSISWKPALAGLHARTKAGAANLRSSADGHEWNDERTSKDFENPGAGTRACSAQLTPGELPAVLPKPVDPRTPYGTNMPGYDDGSITTQPASGSNPFG